MPAPRAPPVRSPTLQAELPSCAHVGRVRRKRRLHPPQWPTSWATAPLLDPAIRLDSFGSGILIEGDIWSIKSHRGGSREWQPPFSGEDNFLSSVGRLQENDGTQHDP